eukprot:m.141262 g.141262  ORF g.141262 m.141262 type:complete len:191 (+) comp14843_c0_seq2:287-859(+)
MAWHTLPNSSDYPKLEPEKIVFVDSVKEVQQLKETLRHRKLIAVDCEGLHLGKEDGTLDIVSLALHKHDRAYILDMSIQCVREFVSDLVTNKSITKIVFDVRNDARAIFKELGAKMENVLDVQVLTCLKMKTDDNCQGTPYRPGLSKLLFDVPEYQILDIAHLKATIHKEGNVWDKRPLPKGALSSIYCC